LEELPKLLEFLFNISATAEASDFKFSMQLGLAKNHYKITPRREIGRGILKGNPKILGSFLREVS